MTSVPMAYQNASNTNGGFGAAHRSAESHAENATNSGLELIATAHVAGQVGRPEDAVRFLTEAANKLYESCPDIEFKAADRSLLAKSLKLVVNPLRNTVRTLHAQADAAGASSPMTQIALLQEYRDAKTAQLRETCDQVLAVIGEILLPMASCAESRVFFNKLAADHARYLCEVPLSMPSQRDVLEREALVARAEAFYEAAFEEAQSDLAPTHPLRLSLILNLAIFHQEIRLDQDRAREIARTAYDDAAAELGIDPSAVETSGGQATVAEGGAPEEGGGQAREAEATHVLMVIRNSLNRWAASDDQGPSDET